MSKVTVSAKISPELFSKIGDTGFNTTDIVITALELFLSQAPEQQKNLIWIQMQRKKIKRAMTWFGS